MAGFEGGKVPAFFLDLETQQRRHRAERDAAIRQRQDRETADLARLRQSGIVPANDLLFRNLPAASVSEAGNGQVAATDSGWDRPRVFAHLRSGGSRDGLPAEFVADYDRSKSAW